MSGVKWDAQADYQYVANYKILQSSFKKVGVEKVHLTKSKIRITKTCRGCTLTNKSKHRYMHVSSNKQHLKSNKNDSKMAKQFDAPNNTNANTPCPFLCDAVGCTRGKIN